MNIKNSEHLYRNVLALLLMFASACGGSANKSSLHASHQAAAADETSDLPLCPVGCAPIITGPSEGSFHPVSPGGDIGAEPITPPPAAAEPTPAPPAHEGSGGSGLTPLPPLQTLPAPEPAPADTNPSSAPKAPPAPASLPNFTPNFPPVPQTPDFKLPNQPDSSTTGAGNSSTGATLASLYAAYFGAQVAKLDADVVAANASAAAALASGRESRAKHKPQAAGKVSAGAHPVSSSLHPEEAALLAEAWMYRDRVADAIMSGDPRAQERQDLVKVADSGLTRANDAFAKGERAVGEFSYRLAVMALDMAISVSPAGWAKFGMEAMTGRNMLTHEPLNALDRGLAIAVTVGTIGAVVASSEVSIPAMVALEVIGSALKSVSLEVNVVEYLKVAEVADRLGATSIEAIQDLASWLKKPLALNPESGAIGSRVDRVLEVIGGLRPEEAALSGREIFADVPKAMRPNVWDIMESLPPSLKGDSAAKNFIDSLRPHELTSNFRGWTSLDLVPNNPSASPLRLLYKVEADGGIKWMIRDTH